MKKKVFESNFFFYTILFIVFFVFFSYIHPLVPFDSDDWLNMGMSRRAYPSLRYWNPTKVFPECFEPMVAMFAAFCITPIIGDYLNAQIIANALVVSIFINLYFYSAQRLLEHIFKVTKIIGRGLIVLFALFHFWILRTEWSNNEYLFYSHDCNCYYHYTIPNLLCASLVMWLMCHDVRRLKDLKTMGILLVVTYLALCSNLYSTIILTAYAGSVLVIDLYKAYRKNETWLPTYIRKHNYLIILIFLWLIIQMIEANGRRATAYGHLERSLVDEVSVTLKYFTDIHYNFRFVLLAILSIIAVIAYRYLKEKKKLLHVGRIPMILIISIILSSTYLILLSSRVSVIYIKRGDVIFSYAFFLLLMVILCIGYLCVNVKYFKLAIPFLMLFVFFDQNTSGNVYKEVQHEHGLDAKTCILLDRSYIEQVREADALNQDTVTIKVPWFNDDDNWPLCYEVSSFFGTTLYKHNITTRRITTLYDITK